MTAWYAELELIDPESNHLKFWRVYRCVDMCGSHVVEAEYGRIGTENRGQIANWCFRTEGQAQVAMEAKVASKLKKGYQRKALKGGVQTRVRQTKTYPTIEPPPPETFEERLRRKVEEQYGEV